MSHGSWKDLFKAVEQNDIELVDFYIRQGLDLNYQHPEYMTNPLFESIKRNNLEMLSFLLENGARPDVIEAESNKSALAIAKDLGNEAAVKMLSRYLPESN